MTKFEYWILCYICYVFYYFFQPLKTEKSKFVLVIGFLSFEQLKKIVISNKTNCAMEIKGCSLYSSK